MGSGHVVLLVIVFLALCVSAAGILAGAAGYSWFKFGKREQGLWRACLLDGDICGNRDNILEFKGA